MSYNDSNKPSANNSKGLFVTFVDREIIQNFVQVIVKTVYSGP